MRTIRSRPLSHRDASAEARVFANLSDSSHGAPLRLMTRVSVSHDETRLFVTFEYEDDHVVATLTRRDEDLYTEDVLEIFLAPRRLEEYFEIEVSPLGTLFDARVWSPDRRRATMEVDRSWDCDGLSAVTETIDEAGPLLLRTVVTVPFRSLGLEAPRSGEEWRANFYRIDRHPEGDLFAAWSPTGASPPDFHLPERFGTIIF